MPSLALSAVTAQVLRGGQLHFSLMRNRLLWQQACENYTKQLKLTNLAQYIRFPYNRKNFCQQS